MSDVPLEISPEWAGEYPNHYLFDPSQRPMRIAILGAGVSGLVTAIELLKLPHVELVVYEKNAGHGGTWYENRYPGATSDLCSHVCQFCFEPNPKWSHLFSGSDEIRAYLQHVSDKYQVTSYLRLSTRVTKAKWDETKAKWCLNLASTSEPEPNGRGPEVDEVDLFVNAGGIVNNRKYSNIPGLDSFQGKVMHTADWNREWDYKGKRVAVIGSGASAVQLIATIQPDVAHLDQYIRTPSWVVPTYGFGKQAGTFNEPFTSRSEKQIKAWRENPEEYRAFRKSLATGLALGNMQVHYRGSNFQNMAREAMVGRMKEVIKSPELQAKLIPEQVGVDVYTKVEISPHHLPICSPRSFEFGCRRIIPGLTWMQAVQEPNVSILRGGIEKVTPDSVISTEGERKVDAILCATGFNNSFTPPFPIEGLKKDWADHPEAYLSMGVAGYPNYFMCLGPNTTISNGDTVNLIHTMARYIRQAVEKMQKDQIRTLQVREKVQQKYNEYIQKILTLTVFVGACNSWYQDPRTGRVTALYPGSGPQFMELAASPRWEDYEIHYMDDEQPFNLYGAGYSRLEAVGGDLTWYLNEGMVEDEDGRYSFKPLEF